MDKVSKVSPEDFKKPEKEGLDEIMDKARGEMDEVLIQLLKDVVEYVLLKMSPLGRFFKDQTKEKELGEKKGDVSHVEADK